jgi:hypothetical protein
MITPTIEEFKDEVERYDEEYDLSYYGKYNGRFFHKGIAVRCECLGDAGQFVQGLKESGYDLGKWDHQDNLGFSKIISWSIDRFKKDVPETKEVPNMIVKHKTLEGGADFVDVAAIAIDEELSQKDNLERAFTLTNSVDEGWWLNEEVKTLTPDKVRRSTSMGDAVVLKDKTFICEAFGWKEVTCL